MSENKRYKDCTKALLDFINGKSNERFILKYPHWTEVLIDLEERKEYRLRMEDAREDVVDLLNELYTQNIQLYEQVISLSKQNNELTEENNDLKITIKLMERIL